MTVTEVAPPFAPPQPAPLVTRRVALPGLLAGLMVLFCAGLIPFLTWRADTLQSDGRRELIDGIALSFAAMELKFSAADVNGWQTGYALDIRRGAADASKDTGSSRRAFLESARALRTQIESLESMNLSEEQHHHLRQAHRNFDEFMRIDANIIAAYRGGNAAAMREADRLVMEDEIRLFELISNDVGAVASSVTIGAIRNAGDAEIGGRKARALMIASSLIAIALAVSIGLLLRRWMLMTNDLVQQLEQLAGTDQLTGVPNRRTWNEQIRLLEANARRSGQPLTLAIFDVDEFKKFNDHNGHLAGDDMLRRIAQSMHSLVRAGDLFARFGGEEFVLALSNCPISAGEHKVRELLRSLPSGQTCSAGLTELHASDDLDSALVRADRALYQAKGQGRNRAVVLLHGTPVPD